MHDYRKKLLSSLKLNVQSSEAIDVDFIVPQSTLPGQDQRLIEFWLTCQDDCGHCGRVWPAPGSEDTELGVFMEPEVSHGETEV